MTWDMRSEFNVLTQLGQVAAFPDNYFVADVETTGYSFNNDYIIDVGWCVVRDGQIGHNEGLLLDWTKHPHADIPFIRGQLERQAAEYAKIGRPHYYPFERLCDEGIDPREALHTYATLIWDYINRGEQIVGHGLWRFDRKMIDSHTQRFLKGYLLPWRQNSIMDTGLMEKAMQMNRAPWQGETLDEWNKRINNANQKGVKWNLESHCVPKYRIAERFGLNMGLMHTGGFDCVLIHYLLKTFRELAEVLNGQNQGLICEIFGPEGGAASGQTGANQGPPGLR